VPSEDEAVNADARFWMLMQRWVWAIVALALAAASLVVSRTSSGSDGSVGGVLLGEGVADLQSELPTEPSPPVNTPLAPTASDPASSTRAERRLDVAWRDRGCALNPGNPGCLTIMQAVGCARSASDPGCQTDSDGDGCLDVAEVQFGFDPFAPADCVGGARGKPAVNCLFQGQDRTCGGEGVLQSPPALACGAGARDRPCDAFGTGHK
jgi:hypothetical protein